MKAKNQGRGFPQILKLVALMAVAWAGITFSASAQGADPAKPAEDKKPAPAAKKAEEPADSKNWLEMSAGSFFVDGDRAQFQRRQGLPGKPFGGVEDFHWEQEVGKKGLFSVDGRGIYDNHDYLLKMQLAQPDMGFLRFGYREFRTWYDGSGGFFPNNRQWFSLYDDQMHIDRGEFWFEGGLRLPNVPQLTFRYSHELRDGQKDSTAWGDTGLTGLAVAPPDNLRGIVPSFWDIDETRDSFALDLKHKTAKTDFGVGVRYDIIDNNNKFNQRRQPGEAEDRFVTQRDEFQSDMFNAHAFTETRFNGKVLLTSGYSFTTLDTDIGGRRIYGSDYDGVYDPLFAQRQFLDAGFLDLHGGSQLKQYVLNLSLMLTPWGDTLAIVPSVRVEHQDQESSATFTATDVGAPPALAPVQEPLFSTSDRGFTDVSQALEVRYTGVTNWVFYVRGEWMEGQGDLKEEQHAGAPFADPLLRDTDDNRFMQKYSVGANWYPLRRVNLAAQYYHKAKENDYDRHTDSTDNAPPSADRYPAFLTSQDFKTDDVNFRVTWRPLNNLTLVSRYDFQLSTVDTKASYMGRTESAEMTTHILSQSIGWNPLARLYLQGSINYVLNKTETPGDGLTDDAVGVAPDSQDNYWNATAVAGYALDDKTDVQAQYLYYRANNFKKNDSLFTQPYGAGAEEHAGTVALHRQITPALRWTLKYGFFSNRDQTSGGHNNYEAHGVYSSLQCRF